MVEDDVQFACTGSNGGSGFFQLGVGVLGSFMEADDAGYDDGRAFEIGYAAGNVVQANAYALDMVRVRFKKTEEHNWTGRVEI